MAFNDDREPDDYSDHPDHPENTPVPQYADTADGRYREALRLCLDRYDKMAAWEPDLTMFLLEARDKLETHSVAKLCRWLGYIQGVLIERGRTSVYAERTWTRPLFQPLDSSADLIVESEHYLVMFRHPAMERSSDSWRVWGRGDTREAAEAVMWEAQRERPTHEFRLGIERMERRWLET